jgi:DNA-binding response OmpR family regulator
VVVQPEGRSTSEGKGLLTESIILIVGDEPMTSKIWSQCVAELRSRPMAVNTSAQAVALLEEVSPDLIVVDVTSRQVSGIEVCAALREHTAAPVLLLTPVNNESHTLEAYQAGADECIVKPISPALFLAKLRVWLRRSWTVQVESLDQLTMGDLSLEPARHRLVGKDGRHVHLSNLEFRVLYLLMSHANQPFSTDEIIERVWGIYGDGSSALVKNVIYRLRKKIETNPNQPLHIRTETGAYVFRR